MTKDNMTIRFTPDGFSFIEHPDDASPLLDEAPFHEVAPGPDFQQRLHEAVLDALPQRETPPDLTVQLVSTRVVVLPPDITDPEVAEQMFQATFTEADEAEQTLLQPLDLPNGQQVNLCFAIDRSLLHFLKRNYSELRFEHHLATLLLKGARQADGNTLVVQCLDQFLEVALFRQAKLSLVNVYRSTQAANRNFYVMNTWIQEHLDQLHDSLLILGHGDATRQLHQDLRPFIKQILQQ